MLIKKKKKKIVTFRIYLTTHIRKLYKILNFSIKKKIINFLYLKIIIFCCIIDLNKKKFFFDK